MFRYYLEIIGFVAKTLLFMLANIVLVYAILFLHNYLVMLNLGKALLGL